MIEITAYQAKDGRLFSTFEEAFDYEEALKWGKQIDKFAKSGYCPYSGVQISIVRKTIIAWERFKSDEVNNAIREQTQTVQKRVPTTASKGRS